jgi:hypothetical protein
MKPLYVRLLIGSIIASGFPFILLLFSKPTENYIAFDRVITANGLKMISYFPVDFRINAIEYHDGSLFAYNLEGGQVIQFDTLGNVTNVFGKMGEAPGEISLLTSFNVDHSGVHTIDLRNKAITQFRLGSRVSDGPVQYARIGKNFSKGIYLGSNNFLLSYADPSSREVRLGVFRSDGSIVRVMNSFYSGYKHPEFATDGFFVKGYGSTERNFHICYNVSRFSVFDNTGKLRLSGSTIENYNKEPGVVDDGKNNYLSTGAKTLNYAACADENNLYVVSSTKSTSEESKFFDEHSPIDVYGVHKGQYQYSYYVENYKKNKIRTLAKSPKGFFAVQGDNVVYYEKN